MSHPVFPFTNRGPASRLSAFARIHRGVIVAALLASSLGAIAAEKLVIAHYMTDMVPRTDRPLSRWIDPELADPNGRSAALGGIHLTVPMAALHLKNANLTQAVDFEIRAARQLGLDGFQFYYPLGDNTRLLTHAYNPIIREFIRLCDERHSGFRISICLAHPSTGKPITHKLASVTVLHPSTMTADAMATALLVLGPERGFELAVMENLAVMFIVRDKDNFIEIMTPQFQRIIVEPE